MEDCKDIVVASFSPAERVELLNPLSPISNIRFSYNFSSTLYLIDEQFADTASLIKSLIIFFHNEIQNNLFGFGSFDVAKFAKFMGYSVTYLNLIHPCPEQLKGKSEAEIAMLRAKEKAEPEKYKIWDSYLENALYILSTQSVNIKYGSKIDMGEDKYVSSGIVTQRYLSSISMFLKKGQRREKKVYQYQLEPEFLNSTRKFYTYMDFNKVLKFKAEGLDNIYMFVSSYICNFLNQQRKAGQKKGEGYFEADFFLFFDMCKKLLNVSCKQEKENKRKIKIKLDKFRLFLSPDDFMIDPEWVPVSETSKSCYKVNLHLKIPKSRLLSDEEENSRRERLFYESCFYRLYNELFPKYYYEIYSMGTLADKVITFSKWLKDDTLDYDDKIHTITYVRNELFGVQQKPSFLSEDTISKRYFNHLKEINIEKNAFGQYAQLISDVKLSLEETF